MDSYRIHPLFVCPILLGETLCVSAHPGSGKSVILDPGRHHEISTTAGEALAFSSKHEDLYERAGIRDVAEFYRARYVSEALLDANYFHAINRFDIRWSRTMWVYDNVRPRSRVLDLGCGGGILALLKRKEVTLIGVDLSADCARAAHRNGYDATYVAQLTDLPFADASFDYVVSLDVMGHIIFDEKDAVLREVKRVLHPEGVTLHGIECLNRDKRKGYEEMSEEELRRFISIDGHVGMEEESIIASRFRRLFKHVRAEPRYSICQPLEEFIKQADEYGTPLCDEDFLDYLRRLSDKERRAFNMAMGYVFDKISEHEIRMPQSEYLFLKASDAPLESFYREHYNRTNLFPSLNEQDEERPRYLDKSTAAVFDSGWYEAEIFPPIARWMSKSARISFSAASISKLRFDLTTHLPDVEAHPLNLELFLDGVPVSTLSLTQHGWLELGIVIPDATMKNSDAGNWHELEIRADRTWQPRPDADAHRDDRELSIAVCNIQIFP